MPPRSVLSWGPGRSDTPPGASHPEHPLAPAPQPLSPGNGVADASRSLPTRSGTPGSSPGDHFVPGTLSFHPLATFPGLRSDTSVTDSPLGMDPQRIDPQSDLPGRNSHAQLPLLRYRSPPPNRAPLAVYANRAGRFRHSTAVRQYSEPKAIAPHFRSE